MRKPDETSCTMNQNKRCGRLLTIQDLSCVGKCSLTIALPVLSAMGIETSVLPTALLSAHTMFRSPFRLDLTNQLASILSHWKREKITFDTIYTGYLASARQMDIAETVFREFGPEGSRPFIIIDPAMADYGRLYSGFDDAFVKRSAVFCSHADVLLPNLTEAHFLTGLPYREAGSYDRQYVSDLLDGLCALGPRWAVLTGVSFEEGKTGIAAKNREAGEYFEYFTERIPANYHGTGDLFASVTAGALSGGLPLSSALRLAADYVRETIYVSAQAGREDAYGVCFESTLPWLIRQMEDAKKECLKLPL